MNRRALQVNYNRQTVGSGTAIRQISKTDFAFRMRNKLAAELRRDEAVVDDDYAVLSHEAKPTRLLARKPRSKLCLVFATTDRIRVVVAGDEEVLDARWKDLRLVHDEDDALTLLIRQTGHASEPITLVFPKRRSPVAKVIRERCADDDPGGSSRGILGRLRPGS